MNLRDLQGLTALSGGEQLDPEVRAALNRAIVDLAGYPTTERRLRTWTFYIAVWAYIVLTVATAVIVLLASTKVIPVEEKWLGKAWDALVVQFVGIIFWIIKSSLQQIFAKLRD